MEASAFGMGCFAFEWRGEARDNYLWKETLEKALNSLANVRDVDVEVRGFVGPVDAEDENARRIYFRPNPCPATVQFTIHIPGRIQSDLSRALRTTGAAETFHVFVYYDLHGPVAFVAALDGDDEARADRGVVVVREFLRQNMKGDIALTAVGPSPFHSSMFLRPALDLIGPFGLQIVRQEGYDQHNFLYSPHEFGSIDEARYALFSALSREGSLFYRIVRERNRRLERSVHAANATQELIEVHTAKGARARARRWFKGGSQARDLLLHVLQAESEISRDGARDAERLDSHYVANGLPAFREEAEAEASETFQDQLDNARRVAELLERGRGKEFELLVLATSTLLGGAAGAIAALLTGA